ncbi:hypothetical protein DSO57_1014997 [Entomophthora muscae]|uniref:Uncharacterized protein n=1 Tax=Entomophthora muscae TaxID=34485 RepID=A0ACC2URX3_9FUNG|nr:hypothetical protein DSO57_1014997 [Entomophthora muscae]
MVIRWLATMSGGICKLTLQAFFLLILAQMTGGGMHIIYTLDEVDFIQNLVFYIERAYRTPDYGIWERGNKSNHGIPELNCSSIGMVVAALLAIDGVNLFGSRGGPASVIHVLPDEVTRNYTTLHSFLPRESNSKEIDAALLSIVGFPAFAVGDCELATRTRNEIIEKLGGDYGCKRFLRDGHQTVLEDHSRLHYEPSELKIFEDIECEWPLFFTYLILDGEFSGDHKMAQKYRDAISPLLVDSQSVSTLDKLANGEFYESTNFSLCKTPPHSPGSHRENFPLVPELYYVPRASIEAEKAHPNSQKRLPNDNVPLVWANSLYFLGNLLHEGLLDPSQLDPLGRRISNKRDSNPDTVVQVILLSETTKLKKHLATFGVETQTLEEISPITVCSPLALKEIYATLGMNAKLRLSGRPKRPIGTLGTSRLYRIKGQLYAFTPHFMDHEHFYLTSDNQYFISVFEQELQFVQKNWFYPGRPTMSILLTEDMLGARDAEQGVLATYSTVKVLLDCMFRLKAGSCNGVRIRTGRIHEMVSTSSVTNLDFLVNKNDIDWPLTLAELSNSSGAKGRLRTSRHTRLRRSSSSVATSNNLKTPITRTESQDYFRLPGNVFKLRKHEESPDEMDEDDSGPSSPREPLSLNLGDSSQTDKAIDHLMTSNNLYDQMDLAHYLHSCHGNHYHVEPLGVSLAKVVDEIYSKSITLKLWSIVRQSAGVLQKMADSLTINITDLIVRQKRVSVGSGEFEHVIDTAVTPDHLQHIIYSACTSDVREGPLVQELLTFLGSFIRADPTMFDGILQLRLRSIVISLREEISRMETCNEDDAVETLMQMSPFEIKSLLATILSGPTLSTHDAHEILDEPQARQPRLRNTEIPDSDFFFFTVRSGGFAAGKFAFISINGQEVPINDRGFNIVSINMAERVIVDALCFDTHFNENDSHELAGYIDTLQPGIIVIGAINDDASEKLTSDAIQALKSLGLNRVDRLGYRSSYCFIGFKGSAEGLAVEDYVPVSTKAAEIIEHALSSALVEKLMNKLAPRTMTEGSSAGRWLRRRKNDGSFNRVPNNFFPRVWKVLANSKCLRFGRGAVLPRDPTVSEKTADEFNFAMLVEQYLSNFQDPAERQVATELLSVLSYIQENLPQFPLKGQDVDLTALIQQALVFFWEDWVEKSKAPQVDTAKPATPSKANVASDMTISIPPSKLKNLDFSANIPLARRLFYDLPQHKDRGTLYYLAAAILCQCDPGTSPSRDSIDPKILADIFQSVVV